MRPECSAGLGAKLRQHRPFLTANEASIFLAVGRMSPIGLIRSRPILVPTDVPTEPQATAARLRGPFQHAMYHVACLRRRRSGTRPTDLSAASPPCRGLEIVATTKRADVETRRNGVFDLLAVSWRLCPSQVHLPTCPNHLRACAEQLHAASR